MNIICPQHGGVVNVSGSSLSNTHNVSIINLIVECPVCEEEVLINGVFNFDRDGRPFKVDKI
jgi:hypothetical protein